MVTANAVRWALPRPALDAVQEWLRAREHDPSVVVDSVDLVSAHVHPDDLTAQFAITLHLRDGQFLDVTGEALLTVLPLLLAA